jgi:hypothetical protein
MSPPASQNSLNCEITGSLYLDAMSKIRAWYEEMTKSSMTTSAPARVLTAVWIAVDTSCSPRSRSAETARRSRGPAASISRTFAVWPILAEFQRTVTLSTPGNASRRSSRRLPLNSGDTVVRPVTFPPGCARLATSPAPIGSETLVTTIGIVVVALFAASAAGVLTAKITSTRACTRSRAKSPSRSFRFSANRSSMIKFRPSM